MTCWRRSVSRCSIAFASSSFAAVRRSTIPSTRNRCVRCMRFWRGRDLAYPHGGHAAFVESMARMVEDPARSRRRGPFSTLT